MPSTFSGLYISLRSMQAQQKALETTSHNASNASTPGYSRQRAELQTTAPWPVPSLNMPAGAGQVGTGVEISDIQRIRDTFVDSQIRSETEKLGEWEQRSDALEQIETIFMEPTENGLNSLLNQFWESWQELSENPESSAVRTTVLETSKSLTEATQHTYDQLDELQSEMDTLIDLKVQEVNTKTKQIADLNEQIKNIKAADLSPNDLMDERDLLLDELSKIVNIKTEEASDGMVDVHLAGQEDAVPLVEENTQNKMIASSEGDENGKTAVSIVPENNLFDKDNPIEVIGEDLEPDNYSIYYDTDNADNTIELRDEDGSIIGSPKTVNDPESENPYVLGDSDQTAEINLNTDSLPEESEEVEIDILKGTSLGGEMSGLFKSRDTTIQKYIDNLDNIAENLADEVNDIHEAGVGLDGVSDRSFFKDTEGVENYAGHISLHEDIEDSPMSIAAAQFIDPNLGTGVDLGDDLDLKNENYRIEVLEENEDIKLQLQKIEDDSWAGVGKAKEWTGNDNINLGDGDETIEFTTTETEPKVGSIFTIAGTGNGSNALKISQLRQEEIIDGATIDDYYRNSTSALGVETHEAQRMQENQEALVEQLENRKESISGVSIDEEMAHMVEHQHAYQAAARFMSTLDELLDTLINRTAI